MHSLVFVAQLVAGIGGLMSAIGAVVQIVIDKVRGATLLQAIESGWLTSKATLIGAAAAALGWAASTVLVARDSNDWRSSLVLSLAGALFFSGVYWLITKGGRSVALLLMLIVALPLFTGLVVAL